MRKAVLSILLLTVSFVAIGQTTFNRLEYYFGPNPNSADFFENIIQYNGYYYGTVDLTDSVNVASTGIVKLDEYGNLVKKKILKLQSATIVTYQNQALINTIDSNLMICSNLVHDSTGSWDGYLIKLDTSLDTLWTKVYDLPANLAGCSTGTNTVGSSRKRNFQFTNL